MPEITVELAVGDVLVIGNRTVTVIDIEGLEVHFRVDDDIAHPPQTFQALIDSEEARALRQKAK